MQKYCFSKNIDFEKPMNKPNLQQIQNNKMFLSCEVTKERGIYEKDVFISYASPDKKAAQNVVKYLEDNSINCFIAPRDVDPEKPMLQI